jgi:GNAT superfamily N-acetyltransferase
VGVVLTTRVAGRADAAVIARLWRSADAARQAEVGLPSGPVAGAGVAEAEQHVHLRLADPASFALLVEEAGDPVAMALVLQALARDGAGPDPLPGVAHISMVAVRPDRWGQGLGALVLDRAQHNARNRGFTRAQLWTQETNRRAQRLYERLGWTASGRTKADDHGERIRHYVRAL